MPRHRKDEARIQTLQSEIQREVQGQEGVKPESVKREKPAAPGKQDVLLAEKTVSNKEQRKADWAIMKEMSRYLWPKVSIVKMCVASLHL